ncbi:trans-Golgi network membrane protein [Malassezia pachydermatis]|uniref:Scamp-domain-containing protein n=1 Tax=Malassezia pachydermatis TaxID=77020 RepID=A0A0M8MMI9_9BASI|nr:scamp-domain-containing protein [Malassezia pachydermatis]KOS14568.1 scamp-domain-containing protein [Malassezia pachydermatis]
MAGYKSSRRDSDPFDDPSIQSAVKGGDYDDLESNPFETTSLRHGEPGYAGALEFEDDQDEIYPTSTHGTAPAHAMRMEDLQRRERELEERERELDARTEHMRKFGRNNWPPFYPIVYHDISSEIPPDSQHVMMNVYRLWLLLVATLIWNFVTCLLILFAVQHLSDLINSVVYLVVVTAASFFLWYRPLYFGLMKEHSLFYYVYFLFCGCHLLFSAYAFIGPVYAGCAGVLTTMSLFNSSHWIAGAFGVVSTVGFALQGLGQLWYYRIIWRHNHEQGHSFAQAQAELASHGMRAYFLNSARM